MKRFGFILTILFIIFPCYSSVRIPEEHVNKLVVFDPNKDQKNELLALKGQTMVIYSLNEQENLTKLNEFSINIPIKDIFVANNDIFIWDKDALYKCRFLENEIVLEKIVTLDSTINFIYDVYRNNDNLIITAAKILEYEPLKVSLIIIEIDANKNMIHKELMTIDWVHTVFTNKENGIKFIVITGIQDKIGKLIIYELSDSQLNHLLTTEIPGEINTLSFILLKKETIYFSSWYGDIETNQAFPGIFAFALDKEHLETVVETGLTASSIEINDFNNNGRDDLIWADKKSINVEFDIFTEYHR